MQKIAKEGGEVIFSEQKTQNKCGGANKKLNFLIEELSHTQGMRYKFKGHLYTGCKAMLSSPLHAKMIEQMYVERDMPYSMLHQLIEVDVAKNTALFQRSYVIDGEVRESSTFERSFDYLFMVPKMKAPDFIAQTNLHTQSEKGNLVDVDKFTLQHKNFKNIFAIGDCAGIPKGKTGASISKQYPVVTQNIIDYLQNKELSAKFSGYTACPLLTKYGKVVMVEFDYNGHAPMMECFGATRESYINWFIKVKLMKPMVMKGIIYARA